MAPAATNGAAGGGFAAATASLRQCIAANYQKGEAGKAAVLAAVKAQIEGGGEAPGVVGEALEVAFRKVLNEDLMARALPAGQDVLVRAFD